jgi:hypothetical protein
VQKVKDCAGPLNQSVTAYEQYLTEHLKKMADLGYIPPVELDEGPGGIVVPDPTAAADGTSPRRRRPMPRWVRRCSRATPSTWRC